MGILATCGEVELIVTWVCNWHCRYCAVDTHNRPKLDITTVMKKIECIAPGSLVTLSGGEVGAMSRKDIQSIIDALLEKSCTLHLNTNGLFLKRYSDLAHYFDAILYHCSEDLDPVPIHQFDIPHVEYMIIVTDQNIHKLGHFLEQNPSIKFHIVASTMPSGVHGDTLSQRNRYMVITRYHNRMTDLSKMRMFKEKDFDAITYL